MPRISCLGLQVHSQQNHDSEEEKFPEQDPEQDEQDPEQDESDEHGDLPALQPLFRPAPAPTKRTVTSRKNVSNVIVIGDPVPNVPAAPHLHTRQTKPTIVVHAQQLRGATKTSPKKLKASK